MRAVWWKPSISQLVSFSNINNGLNWLEMCRTKNSKKFQSVHCFCWNSTVGKACNATSTSEHFSWKVSIVHYFRLKLLQRTALFELISLSLFGRMTNNVLLISTRFQNKKFHFILKSSVFRICNRKPAKREEELKNHALLEFRCFQLITVQI